MFKVVNSHLSIYLWMFLFTCVFSSCNFQNLKIQSFKVQTTQDLKAIEINGKGEVSINGQAVARIFANGLVKNNRSDTLARLNENGLLVDKNYKPLLRILSDGSIDYGSGNLLSWTQEGEFFINPSASLKITPNNPELYQLASLAIALQRTVLPQTPPIELTKKN